MQKQAGKRKLPDQGQGPEPQEKGHKSKKQMKFSRRLAIQFMSPYVSNARKAVNSDSE